jgi:hypothetical protein
VSNQADYSKIESTIASIRNKQDARNSRLGLFLDTNKKKELASYKARRDQVYKEYLSYVTGITNLEKLIAGGTLAGTNLINARKNVTILKSRRDDAWKRYQNLSSQINKIKPAQKLFFPSSGTGAGVKKPSGPVTVVDGGKVNPKGPYRYNAPLLKNALHNPLGPQASSLDNVSINQGNYTDARQAWTGVTPGRGTFQMDKKFVVAQLDGLNRSNSKQVDDQLYGFKFLYNPTSVTMGWGIQGAVNPEYQASGKDEAIPISAGLFSSQIQFSIILNRIEDMNYLDKLGYVSEQQKKIGATGAPSSELDPAQRNRIYSANVIGNSPYGENVSIEDQQSIYNRGTMYDIEYLFKTINGPHATFKSELNGTTADRGYMRMSILELHLGANMRYRVRISDLGINHTIFNNRMVPILSTVNFTCHRFIDYSIQDKTSGSGSSSSNTTTLRNTTPGYGR